MILNQRGKTMDMESMDINYMLGAYLVNYLFDSRNEDPKSVVFPMFPSFPHPKKPGVMIPIKWIAPDDPIALGIVEDGSNIPEVTPEEEAALDAKDEEIAKLEKEVVELESKPVEAVTEESSAIEEQISKDGHIFRSTDRGASWTDLGEEPSKEAALEETLANVIKEEAKTVKDIESGKQSEQADRVPKMPAGGDLGHGSPDGMGSRDVRLDAKIAVDLKEDADVNEDKEIPAKVEKPSE